jgi:protein-tyrosine-phosphatase
MAAVLVAQIAKKHGVDVEVSSAGATATRGRDAHPNACTVMKPDPSIVAHRSRRIDDATGPFDVVLVFSANAVEAAQALALRTGGRVIECPVADPHNGTVARYEACRDELARIVEDLFLNGKIR